MGTVRVGDHQTAQYCLKLFTSDFFLKVVDVFTSVLREVFCMPGNLMKDFKCLWLSSICLLGFFCSYLCYLLHALLFSTSALNVSSHLGSRWLKICPPLIGHG